MKTQKMVEDNIDDDDDDYEADDDDDNVGHEVKVLMSENPKDR